MTESSVPTVHLTASEIEKFPARPKNFPDLIPDITRLLFRSADHKPADIVFVFGMWQQKSPVVRCITQIVDQDLSRNFILAGGIPNYDFYGTSDKSAAAAVRDLLPEHVIASCKIILQDQSSDSRNDVLLSLPYLESYQKSSVGCVTRSWAFLRQSLTLQHFLPHASLVFFPYDEELADGQVISQHNWYLNDTYSSRIWGEVLRLDLYGNRGDIAYPDTIKTAVSDLLQKAIY